MAVEPPHQEWPEVPDFPEGQGPPDPSAFRSDHGSGRSTVRREPLTTGDDAVEDLPPFEAGFLIGVLVGEGHFGGDGRQPQVTLRMHTDHAALFRWLMRRFPESRLYGPYHHGGRSYYQWMARSGFLRTRIVPLLDRYLTPEHSGRVWARYQQMKQRYGMAAREREEETSTVDDPGSRAGPAECATSR